MKEVTTKYNLIMTAAVILYYLLLSPLGNAETPMLLIEEWYPNDEVKAFMIALRCFMIAVVLSMFIIHSLWNRLIVSLTDCREIDLAESYALMLLFNVLIGGSHF
ncbi:hypothetical protein LNTAR_16538 [Lentisphaera araneosa HTCC2155]|jgi:hypothetical protein|uniref:Uncharacterized protein n=1 Tax=Lentisphaera araneosa HTCC2155 TaxID=313628 RepID=A6DQC2_9BACT|nr:hypothetical protein [Lentisphaera araneosa]EDM26173.1 hypothetical protein LNTAR_16538 [Lentisphaera araneosa HTCC2155]